MKAAFLCAAIVFYMGTSVFAQDFINLDFEQAVVQPLEPDNVSLEWEKAVPGWSHSDGFDTEHVSYNTTHVGVTQAYTLLESPVPSGWPEPLEGSYSLLFRNGSFCTTCVPNPWVHAFVAQTGLVPSEALSIRLKAEGPLSVFLDDLEIPMVSLGGNEYGGDISTYAGSIRELRIQNNRPSPIQQPSSLIVDAIEFSPVAIPEPASSILLLAGGLCFVLRTLKDRREGDLSEGVA